MTPQRASHRSDAARTPLDRAVARWVRTVPVIFLVVGFGFGTWLSRLPAVRDHLEATPAQMSVYGLCLALGSLVGLSVSGRIVQRFGPRPTLLVSVVAAAVALPCAAAVIMHVAVAPGLAVLFVYGFVFSIADIAMNVSGANAENALGKPRMPLMHAGYSLGAVAATGIGAAAERLHVAPPMHFAVVMAASVAVLLPLLRFLPAGEQAMREEAVRLRENAAGGAAAARGAEQAAGLEVGRETGPIPIVETFSGSRPAFDTVTGSIPVAADGPATPAGAARPTDLAGASNAAATGPADSTDLAKPAEPADPARSAGPEKPAASRSSRGYSPWRDPRITLIGLITLSFGLFEGTASDWLPLALVYGRGTSNEFGSLMLSVFFAAVMAVRIAGSALLTRFGRAAVLRCSAVITAAGVVMTIAMPGSAGLAIGVLAWGVGTGLGWPVAISAAADDIETATRDVAAVSAVGYGCMVIGPMAFGLLGEHIGLLTSFWAMLPFAAFVVLAAGAARSRANAA